MQSFSAKLKSMLSTESVGSKALKLFVVIKFKAGGSKLSGAFPKSTPKNLELGAMWARMSF